VATVCDALGRLEVIADTYLSVSTPVQVAAARLIDAGRQIRGLITARIRRNLERLREAARRPAPLTLLEPEGGWSAVVRVPAIAGEEAIAVRLVEQAGVIAHPGYFFDFGDEAFLVLSLLPRPDVFDEGLSRLARFVSAACAS
jgi:hypothetical protein